MTADIYWSIAVVTSALLGLLLILNLFGFDIDDIEIDGLGDAFSFNATIALFCVGGWMGYMAETTTNMSTIMVLVVAIVSGIIFYVISIYVLNKLKGLETSGTVDIENAVGQTATVYLTIPAEQQGDGQIQLIIQGGLKTYDAQTKNEAIPTGTEVLVYDIENGKLLVEPYKSHE